MDEYIKREAAIEAVKHAWAKGLEPSQYIENIPAADVSKVRHGLWVNKGEYAVCTECGGRSGTQYDGVEPISLMTQFCPNCGAKMDGGADWIDVREKLVELLKGAPYNSFGNKLGECYFNSCLGLIADHLIANGVTVQEWISVKDRLPDNKEHDWVLAQVVEDNGYMHIPRVMEYRQAKDDWFEETYGWLSEHNGVFTVTHWMPLPKPPKGE